jgi:hypothetical protein
MDRICVDLYNHVLFTCHDTTPTHNPNYYTYLPKMYKSIIQKVLKISQNNKQEEKWKSIYLIWTQVFDSSLESNDHD